MKVKLVKNSFDGWNHYYLKNENGDTIGTTKHPFPPEMVLISENKGISLAKLSLENCQAIERGYDLDKLIEEAFDNMGHHSTVTIHEKDQFKLGYKLGFQKVLELMCDKKFTERDVLKVVTHVLNKLVLVDGFDKQYLFPESIYQETTTKCKLLQQKEWDVEIVQESAKSDCGPGETNWYNPKLDEKGCLILKRIKHV